MGRKCQDVSQGDQSGGFCKNILMDGGNHSRDMVDDKDAFEFYEGDNLLRIGRIWGRNPCLSK